MKLGARSHPRAHPQPLGIHASWWPCASSTTTAIAAPQPRPPSLLLVLVQHRAGAWGMSAAAAAAAVCSTNSAACAPLLPGAVDKSTKVRMALGLCVLHCTACCARCRVAPPARVAVLHTGRWQRCCPFQRTHKAEGHLCPRRTRLREGHAGEHTPAAAARARWQGTKWRGAPPCARLDMYLPLARAVCQAD